MENCDYAHFFIAVIDKRLKLTPKQVKDNKWIDVWRFKSKFYVLTSATKRNDWATMTACKIWWELLFKRLREKNWKKIHIRKERSSGVFVKPVSKKIFSMKNMTINQIHVGSLESNCKFSFMRLIYE